MRAVDGIDFAGQKGTNLATPTNPGDAVPKSFFDSNQSVFVPTVKPGAFNYTVQPTDVVILATGGTTVTLDAPVIGRFTRVKFAYGSGAVTVLNPSGLLDGQASIVIGSLYAALEFQADGTDYMIF